MMRKRRALVTGGNRGIGLAIAKGLKTASCDVTISVRDLKGSEDLARRQGFDVIQMDLSQQDQIHTRQSQLGEFDILINNAGVLFNTPLFSDDCHFDLTMAVMVHAPYHLITHVLPGMKTRNYGRIVNISSEWGAFAQGLNGPGAYGIAKAALNALTHKAASEVDGFDIQINSMCPGWVKTRMGGDAAPKSPEVGADTAIWLTLQDKGGPNGQFFQDRTPTQW